MKRRLTDIGIAKLRPREKRYHEPDPELLNHYIRVEPTGTKTYAVAPRNGVLKKQVWATTGSVDLMGVDEAREKARDAIKRIKAGLTPFEAPPSKAESFDDIADQWLKRHVVAKGLRSWPEIERLLARHIRPRWGNRDFKGLKRSDVVALLDRVEDEHGARQADYVLAVFRGIANWYAARNDDYTVPIARGMRRTDPKTRKRSRILSDDEIRAVWKHAGECGLFGDFLKLLLLTAQRRERVSAMRWDELADGEWRMPQEHRAKGVGGVLLLPQAAVEIIGARPRIGDNPYVFAGRGDAAISGFGKRKTALDRKLGIQPWVLHDLRRTARSLMARAGVRPDIAERVMGHVIAGVEGVYDRHSYHAEKADALKRLATLIDSIVNPAASNVMPLREAM